MIGKVQQTLTQVGHCKRARANKSVSPTMATVSEIGVRSQHSLGAPRTDLPGTRYRKRDGWGGGGRGGT
jgi:hypothetical protein